MDEIECRYNLGNYIYTIKDTKEVHTRLKSEYIKLNGTNLEYQVQNINTTAEASFVWTRSKTLLLIEAYDARKEKFIDPRIKKKTLWKEIALEFEKKNYYVSAENLDKKFRNLKRTYIKIRDNIRKSFMGKERVTWEYYDYLQKIYEKDYPIMINTSLEDNENSDKISQNLVNSDSSLSAKFAADDDFVEILSDQIDRSEHYNGTTQIVCDTKPNTIRGRVKLRTQRKRQMKTLREEHLNLEKEKIKELRRLREAIENNNEIQRERNQLFSALIMNITCETLNEFKFGSFCEKIFIIHVST
ncbi:uncharacterized protein LOC122635318 isoform X2 [Vespula pensylvanica]|uniref:uncharacterized protein LOC122635318 isoform X2 n=1 Tax=Vespula pensylvanica TaxID=30213 RepID=UPI001CBA51DA|nr:uncharacterized protein LOC122635318 isoform X2 [Vespula pensylvanica]XP_043681315.1 uncharacterized protein LOC122635318 isoform X2 [Vespula pensylvanica]XP_043681316.1 uncharacterized protein LOC122635318 isoform X2 [Vespula pensylvanica]XP_043681317.1 uncharacterized protein LOC122635318 isoform X2 [Vespula pensylvanica]XP_050864897.1 uncharacterized protein LOC127070662 isoform X2 [Vespula vulgaris]XP_050864898.1 uncharacterized protein LOC127070662 isoform X2 [Vespula vulgaris]XP_0508